MPPQIQGLPEGATLKPIQGLPEGAELRPVGGKLDFGPPYADQAGYPHYQGPPPQPSLATRFQDTVDRAATTEPVTGVHSFLNDLGAGATRTMLSPIAHPIETAKGLGKMASAAFSMNPYQMAEQFRPAMEQFAKNPSGEAVAAIPQAAMALASGGEAENIPSRNALSSYKSAIVPAAETNAERLMKAILPQEGVTPGNVKAAMREAPAVRSFAQRTGNPLRTIPEGKIAAQGVADEGLAHYHNQILAPNADERITIENGASPTLGNTATLGQIEKRISDINDLIRGSARTAKSVGQEMTAAEKLGLENEGGVLRQKLYQNLSQKTGISPEDIQSLREGYGGQYTLKNALESGHYGRLTRAGAASQGEGVGIYPSKSGLIEKALTTLRGGPEAIANRQFRKAIRAFEPQEPSYIQPNPPTAKSFAGPYMSDEMARRIGAVGTDQGVQPTPAPLQRPLNGPMGKAATVIDAERVAKALQDEQNQGFHAKRAANQATAGKRLRQGEQ